VLAAVRSAAVLGIEAYPVIVEVHASTGQLPQFTIVGLPSGAGDYSSMSRRLGAPWG